MRTKEQMQNMSEDELVDKVIMPLLESMGYQDVMKTHGGAGEQGKDVVAWKEDDLGVRRNLAVVAKAVRMTGKANPGRGTAGEVQAQIQQCFGKGFLSAKSFENQQVHNVWVVSNRPISKEFAEAIKSMVTPGQLGLHVTFIGGDELWGLYSKHVMPVLHKLAGIMQELDVDPYISPHVQIARRTINVRLEEKFPGAFQEKPPTGEMKLVFPESPEGEKSKEAFQQMIATGAPVELPGECIETFNFPVLEQLTGRLRFQSLQLQMVADVPDLHAKVEIRADDEDIVVLEHIHFKAKQAGAEELTFTNEEQPFPVQMLLVLNLKDQRLRLNCRFNIDFPINAYMLGSLLRLQRCLSKPCSLRVIHFETGIPIFEVTHKQGSGELPDAGYIAAIEDLAAIQVRLRHPIMIPERAWTKKERQTIAKLRTVLHQGIYTCEWGYVRYKLVPEGVRLALKDAENGQVCSLVQEYEEIEELFGAKLPMGRVRYRMQARLENELQVRKRLQKAKQNESISVKFVPGENKMLTVEYLDWVRVTDSECDTPRLTA